MIDWFFDELPYWIFKIEYFIWKMVLLFIKYLVEGVYATYLFVRYLIWEFKNRKAK